jgi:hypothetical protein
MPTRLVVTQVVRMEDSKMWRRFEQKRAELALKGRNQKIASRRSWNKMLVSTSYSTL